MSTNRTFDRTITLLIVFGLFLASLWILSPFWTPLFWASILVFASWPLMRLLTQILKGRTTLAAALLTGLWILLVITPLVAVSLNMTTHVDSAIALFENFKENGLPQPPQWLVGLPLIGEYLGRAWIDLDQRGAQVISAIKPYIGVVGNWLLARSASVGLGIVELSISLVLMFFFYCHGPFLAERTMAILERLTGARASYYMELISGTVRRVINGIIGTAIAQALLALIGFYIVGVPGAMIWGLLTFFFSMLPMGPPLIWIPICIWLFTKNEVGLAIFLALWGSLVISSVDNFLKPILISRGSSMPLILVLLGVFGGMIAFGFMGLFIGPTLLAITYSLLNDWIEQRHVPDQNESHPK